jgi:propionyl-CoA carboxylase alpha chain
MIRAIDDYKISGIQTTLDFCRFALNHEAFRSGNFDTKFVEKFFSPAVLEPTFEEKELELLSALAVEFFTNSETKKTLTEKNDSGSAWRKRLN